MKVKELKDLIDKLPDDMVVIIDTDDWASDDVHIKVSPITFYDGLKRGAVSYENALLIS